MTSETDTWSEISHGEIACSGSNEAQMVVVRTTPRLGLFMVVPTTSLGFSQILPLVLAARQT